jgi:outer membrane protein assembly factor BamB
MTEGYNGAPAAANGDVFLGTGDKFLVALDGKTGRVLWKTPLGTAVYVQPTVVDGTAYVVDVSGLMYAVDSATGVIKWTFATHIASTRIVTIFDGYAYIAANGHNIVSIRLQDHTVRWQLDVETGGHVLGGNAQTVYVGGYQNQVAAVNASTGKVEWMSINLGAGFQDGSQTVGDTLYATTIAGTMFALHA